MWAEACQMLGRRNSSENPLGIGLLPAYRHERIKNELKVPGSNCFAPHGPST